MSSAITLSPEDTQTLFRMHKATTIGARMQALRRFHGLSLNAVGRRAGLSTSVVYNLEHGFYAHGPSMNTVERVADVLGVTTSELLGETR